MRHDAASTGKGTPRAAQRPLALLAFAALVLGLAVLGSTALTAWRERRHALGEARREIGNMAMLLADHTDRAFESLELTLGAILERAGAEGATVGAAPFRDWARSGRVHEALRDRAQPLPQADALLLLGADGRLLSYSRRDPAPENDLSDRAYFRALRDEGRRHAVGPPVANRGTGATSIHVAVRIEGADGAFLGAAVGVVELAYFGKLFGSLELGGDGIVVLFRDDGLLLARHPPAPGSVGRGFGGEPSYRAVLRSPDGTARVISGVDGRERIVAGRALAGFPLRVHVGRDVAAILADWRAETLRQGAGAAMLLALLAALVVAGHRGLRSRAALLARDAEFRAVVEGMSQGIWKLDSTGCLALANGCCTRVLALPQDALRPGATLAELGAAGDGATRAAVERVAALAATGCPGSFVQELEEGRAAAFVLQPLHDGGAIVTIEDVSERHAAQARMHHMARHDALSGLPNRVLLHETLRDRLDRAAAGGGRAALLYLDLDRFKEVNDTLGHAAGDDLLRAVAGRISANVRAHRDGGDLVARLGGDEFAVVTAPGFGVGADAAAEAAVLAARLVNVLSEPFELRGHQVQVGVSIGIALYPVDGETPEELLRAADLALYNAKGTGRGRHAFFELALGEQARAKREVETALRRAVSAGLGEFELHYQPLVGVGARRVAGFEALVRWRRPGHGLVPPALFIPVAEEVGLIGAVGAWVLRRACEQAAAWPDPALRVAVNLSPLQFRAGGLVEAVQATLQATGLAPHRLELEITEGVLLQRTDENLAVLQRLKALGVRIAMDDFGTGYSSLGYLRSFPFDKVKIDRAFVRELATRSSDIAIVQAVTGLCGRLGMTVTAEGVETEEQFAQLAAAQCDEVQGYLFSPPVPFGEVTALLARLQPAGGAAPG